MNITLNGQARIIEGSQTLFELVNQFCRENQRVIAEINGEIIKNPRWNEITIKDGDKIELVNFVGGG